MDVPLPTGTIERHGRFHDFVPRLRDNIIGYYCYYSCVNFEMCSKVVSNNFEWYFFLCVIFASVQNTFWMDKGSRYIEEIFIKIIEKTFLLCNFQIELIFRWVLLKCVQEEGKISAFAILK